MREQANVHHRKLVCMACDHAGGISRARGRRAGSRYVRKAHARGRRDRAMAGQAELAAGIVYHQKIRIIRIDILHVGIVATRALDVSIDELHGASGIGRGGRVCGQGRHQSQEPLSREEQS